VFDDQIAEFSEALNGFIESDLFQLGIRIIVAYIVLIWLASAFWAYRDMRLRSASAFTPYLAAAAIIVFTPIFFLFGLLLYRIVRPKETIAEVNERMLAEEAILAEVAAHSQCANCSRPVHEDWIICPSCRNRLRRVCPNCEHLIELDWTLCAWCGKDFERAEAPGLAYMPAARPVPRPQPALRLPPPVGATPPSPSRGSSGSAPAAPVPPSKPQSAPPASQPPSPAPRSSSSATSGPGGQASSSASGASQATSGSSASGI
jgi:RNA polymerase subunit RPABC4/transcription elongation factor Spt4